MSSNQISKRLLIYGLLLLSLAIGVAYNMWSRAESELLWGYRPLVFLLSGWLAIVAFWQRRRLSKGYSFPRRGLILSTLSGVLLGIGFPDIIPIPFLLFIAWIPLLILESEREEGDKKRVFLRHAFHTFMLWNIIATYWVTNTAFVAGLFANITNSFLMCIPWYLYLISRKHLPRLRYLILIVFWMSFEYIHLQWELTWPWLNLGNSWAEYPSLIQWYEYTGAFGGSLWIWVGNILLLRLWQAGKQNTIQLFDTLKVVVWLLIPMIISIIMYTNYEEKGAEINVVIVQPNYEPHYQKFDIPDSDQLRRFITLGNTQLDENVDYLLYPETSFGWVKEEDVWDYSISRQLFETYKKYPNLKLITGLSAFHDLQPGEARTSATRKREIGGQTIEFETFNLAAQMPFNHEIAPQTYRKSKMVPGAESFPFKKILFFMEPLVNQLGGTVAGLGFQKERSVFSSPTAKIAPVICYESIFGGYFRGYIHAGANAVFIMTNDGWWDNTAGHRQHLHFASLRAIETRRSIARSANTGISAFINQRGDILQATKYNEAIAIKGNIHLNEAKTFYVQRGDIIAKLAAFLSVLFLLNAFVKGRMK